MISRNDVGEYCKGRQQNYAAARVLMPRSIELLKMERDQAKGHIDSILTTLQPLLPDDVNYDVCLIDNCNVAETTMIDDGGQLILINRHFLAFLRNFIELVTRGIQADEIGQWKVNVKVSDDETKQFGLGIGEYLNFGTPLSFPHSKPGNFAPEIFVAAIEFILAHEIVHRIEKDNENYDLELDGFQDFCRIRGREYRCDQKAVALTFLRRKNHKTPEMAFLGAECALTAMSWIEQFTPGYIAESWHHPGSDSRVLRIHLEEPLFWRAAGLDGQPTGLTSAALRRALSFLAALESDPKAIASPLNKLINHCVASGEPDHDLFERRAGELFARGRVNQVSQSFGAMWGSSEMMADEERAGKFEFPQGRLACALFERMHEKLYSSGAAAREIASEITRAKDQRKDSPHL